MISGTRVLDLMAADKEGRIIIRPKCDGCRHEHTDRCSLPCYDCYGQNVVGDKQNYYEPADAAADMASEVAHHMDRHMSGLLEG